MKSSVRNVMGKGEGRARGSHAVLAADWPALPGSAPALYCQGRLSPITKAIACEAVVASGIPRDVCWWASVVFPLNKKRQRRKALFLWSDVLSIMPESPATTLGMA